MYTSNDLQTVQLLPGGNFVAVAPGTPSWPQSNGNGTNGRSSKGTRGGASSKGVPVAMHSLTHVARQVAYIDTNAGNIVTSSGSQGFSRPAAPPQPGRSAPALSAQSQSAAVVQIQGYQTSPQQPPTQQVLQLQTAPATGSHVYKLTNGTRVVKAGQPYPNTTIVQTAVAVPAGPQPLGMMALRPQSVAPAQQVHMQSGGSVQLSNGASQPPQQQQQLHAPQPAKVTLVHHAQPHVLVAQAQQPIHQLQQQQQHNQQPVNQHSQQQQQQQQQPQPQQPGQQQQQAKQQGNGPRQQVQQAHAAFSAIAARPTAIRPVTSSPITIQPVFTPSAAAITTVSRPTMRIPKLGTVATYNPVTGVRSATTASTAPGAGSVTPVLPAGLPATLVQQVQKANLLQQQQLGGLQAVVQMQPPQMAVQMQGPTAQLHVRPVVGSALGVGGGGSQRQTTVMVGGNGIAPASQASGVGITVVGGMQRPQAQHLVRMAGAQLAPQQQQQVVSITLPDGTTATTVMDQATLARMLSESSRGQAVKLQQQQQQRQPAGVPVQVQLQPVPVQAQGMSQQLQQHILQGQHQHAQQQQQQQTSLVKMIGNGAPGLGGSGLAGGVEHLGGLQPVQPATAPGAAAGPPGNGNGTLLIRHNSANTGNSGNNGSNSNTGGRLQLPLPSGPGGQPLQLRGFQVLAASGSQGNLQQSQSHAELHVGAQHPQDQQQHPSGLLQMHQQLVHQGRFAMGQGGPISEGDAAAALLDPSAAFGQLQALGAPHALQQQQPRPGNSQPQVSAMVDGLSVVDLDAIFDQRHQHAFALEQLRNQQQQQQQQGLQAMQQGGLHGFIPNQGEANSNSSLGHLSSEESVSTLVGAMADTTDVAAALAVGGGVGVAPAGGSREDLKVILVSIGQELARHSISVETAVTSGWLGVLTAMDVAVLADAYAEEERRMTQQKSQQQQQQQAQQQQAQQQQAQQGPRGQAGVATMQQHQHQQVAAAAAAAAAAAVTSQQHPHHALHLQHQQPSGMSGPAPGLATSANTAAAAAATPGLHPPVGAPQGSLGNGVDIAMPGDLRRASNGDRSATAAILALTSSSARTSMSVAPSEDGASTISAAEAAPPAHPPVGAGNGSSGGGLGNGVAVGLGGGGIYGDRAAASFNAFQYPYGFFGGGLGSFVDTLAMGGEMDRPSLSLEPSDSDAAALADVFGDKAWPNFGGTLMAEELGLTAQAPPAATQPKLIDSASEYEARMSQANRMAAADKQFQLAAVGASADGDNGGSGGGGPKGVGSAAGGPGGGPIIGVSTGGTCEIDNEMENRFANLDLGCGFY